MEDDGKKEEIQASTSKKENKDRKDRDEEDDRDDPRAYKDDRSYTTGSSSGRTSRCRSRMEMRAENRPENPKQPVLGKREKTEERKDKRKKVRRGRVAKRKRTPGRRARQYSYYKKSQRSKRTRTNALKRDSVSSVFTGPSSHSHSSAGSPNCQYCGHRCCGRRLEVRRCRRRILDRKMSKTTRELLVSEIVRAIRNANRRNLWDMLLGKKARHPIKAEGIQVGSRCNMLSPLFIKGNMDAEAIQGLALNKKSSYTEITPEMIYEALRKLTMWTQYVIEQNIQVYLQIHYPVNRDLDALSEELAQKLAIAVAAGIVIQPQPGSWCLSCQLQNRRLTENHVSLFWKLYLETKMTIPASNKKAIRRCASSLHNPLII